MTERSRPPRARAPSFYLDDQHPQHPNQQQQVQQAQYGGLAGDDSPPSSSADGHSGEGLRQARSKNLPSRPNSPGRPYDDPQSYGGVAAIPSPRSSYSDDAQTPQQHLHLRHVAGAREARLEGSTSSHPGYAGSLQGVQGAIGQHGQLQAGDRGGQNSHGYQQSSHGYHGSVSGPGFPEADRESFFAPPAMPWMRGESYAGSNGGQSAPPSRPESPSFFGGARTSSASPMPFYPNSSFAGTSTYLGVGSTHGGPSGPPKPKRTFQSNLLTGPVEKPWLSRKDRWVTAAWWTTVVLWFAGFAGAGVLCFFAYADTPSVGKVCTSFNDDFSEGVLDGNKWTREVGVGGYGTGGFEWTTNKDENSFVRNGKLYIVPVLTRDAEGLSQDDILDGQNTQIDGCTSADDSTDYFKDKPLGTAAGLRKRSDITPKRGLVGRAVDVVKGPWEGVKRGFSTELPARTNAQFADVSGDMEGYGYHAPLVAPVTGTNSTKVKRQDDPDEDSDAGSGANGTTGGPVAGAANGQHDPCIVQSSITAKAAVNPVQSARLNTKNAEGGSIKYGRVEIKAKMPTGDWLFPQIMMLPKDPQYGRWPLSGEIDIVMSRGNDANYKKGGRDFITGGLQWGPGQGFNAFDRTRGWWQQRRTNFNQAFHTFTLEWTEDFMWIFVDRRVQRVINLNFKKTSFFERGKFPLTFQNGTNEALLQNPWRNGPNVAPFDQEFYLILTVGAGGTNGWFPDKAGNKPWFDRSNAAMFDFANATDVWSKTWASMPEDRAMVIESVKMSKKC